MDLSRKLFAKRQQIAANTPEETLKMMGDMIKGIEESGLPAHALLVGQKAPDFFLSNSDGQNISLTDLTHHGPLVISFYRGDWCPFCSTELEALNGVVSEITDLGGRIVAISPQTPDFTKRTKDKYQLGFEILSDIGLDLARQFGLSFPIPEDVIAHYKSKGEDFAIHHGGDYFELPVPATYIIDQNKIVRYALVEPNFMTRLDTDLILHALQWYVPKGKTK